MSGKKWTKERRANFMRTMAAKRSAKRSVAAAKKPLRKTKSVKSAHGNGAREITILDDGRLVRYRLETVRAYVRVE